MSLVKFLKQHSTIDEDFIDDFFGLYDLKDKYNFCINVEVIAKWLNIRKEHVVDSLRAHYREGDDYRLVAQKSVKGTGRPRNVIMLTPRCFKSLAMQGTSKRAKAVREYYLDLEELLQRYQNYIHEGLREKIQRLRHNQKPKVNPTKGVIYVLQAAEGKNYYKVGRTRDKADDIRPLFLYETDDVEEVEACIKVFLKKHKYRRSKEIYEVDLGILKKMVAECVGLSEKVQLKRTFDPPQDGGNYLLAIYSE